jgi:hypothetical protein
MINKEEITLQCPFCDKGEFKALFVPETIKERKGTWGGRPGRRTIPEKTTVISECSYCGKNEKELQKAIDGKSKELERKKSEKILQRLKDLGITEITTKV